MALTKKQRLKVLAKGREKLKRMRAQRVANLKRVKGKYHQTGASNIKKDIPRRAKKPGYRTSRSGNKYFEARKNRSDIPPGRI